jgi:methionyl-tRNA synthetase
MANYFVTTSLPYANGPLHLGHLLEHIQADIWVRFKKMQGHTCVFVSGDDAHGSAIMLSAEKKQQSPEDYIHGVWQSHCNDLKDAQIGFDLFYTTRSEHNRKQVSDMYQLLEAHGYINEKNIKQAYDDEKQMFLPDRYIKGACPTCGACDQYGDNCEQCGATYLPSELKDPYSVLTGSIPSEKESKHAFFALSACQDRLTAWLASADLQEPVKNKLGEWLEVGLQDWDITRDAPYFGFAIPGRDQQYFYVWMDAPIGYLSTLQRYDEIHKTTLFDEVWQPDSAWQVWHFIGKDIVNFHGVFWPSVLSCCNLHTPTGLHVHGFLTINGEKMSKSRGTFVTARQYLDAHHADYLRYYMAAKLNATVVDMDLNWDDFSKRCSSDLVGKVVNIGSRSASFIHKYFDAKVLALPSSTPLLQGMTQQKASIEKHYDERSFSQVVKEIMLLADQVNQYIDQEQPWKKAKDPSQLADVHLVCSSALHAFKLLMTYLAPIIPDTSDKVAKMFGQQALLWSDIGHFDRAFSIEVFPRLLERIDFAAWFEKECATSS